jgi:hypothetical protein
VKAGNAPQVVIVGVEALRRLAFGTGYLGLLHLGSDHAYHARSHLVLQIKNVLKRSLEAICPKMRSGGGIDQLAGDAHPTAPFAHRPFEHILDVQLAANLLHIDRMALIGEARIARDPRTAT